MYASLSKPNVLVAYVAQTSITIPLLASSLRKPVLHPNKYFDTPAFATEVGTWAICVSAVASPAQAIYVCNTSDPKIVEQAHPKNVLLDVTHGWTIGLMLAITSELAMRRAMGDGPPGLTVFSAPMTQLPFGTDAKDLKADVEARLLAHTEYSVDKRAFLGYFVAGEYWGMIHHKADGSIIAFVPGKTGTHHHRVSLVHAALTQYFKTIVRALTGVNADKKVTVVERLADEVSRVAGHD
jgi:hypothetical protein